jgi:hypothetical protein
MTSHRMMMIGIGIPIAQSRIERMFLLPVTPVR